MSAAIPSGDTYTCAACGETFPKGWSDEEALAESKLLWGDIPLEEQCVICDECFERGKADALAEHHADLKPN